MKAMLFALVLLCLVRILHAETRAQPGDNSLADNGQHLGRRYAESTIASDMSKIMDSMVQKNFVNFLLNQREKKSEPVVGEEDPEVHNYSDLFKRLTLCIHNKADRSLRTQ